MRKLEGEFGTRLLALARSVDRDGESETGALIDSLVAAGATSEESMIRMARDPRFSTGLRASICWVLARIESTNVGQVLLELLSDPSEPVREEAAVGVGLVRADGAVEALLDAVAHDVSKSVRLAALRGLGIVNAAKSVPALLALIANLDEDPVVRADAAEACAHIHAEHVVDALLSALTDSSSMVRYSAAYALGEQHDPRAIPPLTHLAAHDDAATPWGTGVRSPKRTRRARLVERPQMTDGWFMFAIQAEPGIPSESAGLVGRDVASRGCALAETVQEAFTRFGARTFGRSITAPRVNSYGASTESGRRLRYYDARPELACETIVVLEHATNTASSSNRSSIDGRCVRRERAGHGARAANRDTRATARPSSKQPRSRR